LFELLVVLAILGLIGGLIYPGLARAIRGQQFRGAAAGAVAILREARARAFARQATVRIRAGGDGGQLRVDDQAPEPLPADVRAIVAPASGILFFGDGTSSGGALLLQGEGRRVRLVVAPATGLVRGAG
jgi:general secretion pathway protein H